MSRDRKDRERIGDEPAEPDQRTPASRPASELVDPAEVVPVPPVMSPAEVDERAQVVEELRRERDQVAGGPQRERDRIAGDPQRERERTADDPPAGS